MFEFLKKILSLSNKKLTVLVWEESEPDETENFRIRPARLVGLIFLSQALVVGIVLMFLFLTPLGYFFQLREDARLQAQVQDIYVRVMALRDSLDAREVQLANFKRVLAASVDTTFETNLTIQDLAWLEEFREEQRSMPEFDYISEIRGLSIQDIMLSSSGYFNESIDFPMFFPLDGTITRRFDPSVGHYGYDIAAAEGTYIRAFADGVVIFESFTVNYGYVISVQHPEGYLAIYKHCKNLLKRKGDFVKKGDIIGRVGSYGLISSGPHLHFELWRDGVALDPSLYFTNLN